MEVRSKYSGVQYLLEIRCPRVLGLAIVRPKTTRELSLSSQELG